MALTETLVDSPLVSRSPLSGPFQVSRGFGFTFRGEGQAEVEARVPALRTWFDLALGEPAVEALRPWWRRRPVTLPNAWYLNLLLIGGGGTVERHVDATLCEPSGVDDAVPTVVSVLYLQVPFSRGGELQLFSGSRQVAAIRPRAGSAVHFRGDLAHAVTAHDGATGALRASLVLEQYHFDDDALARLPVFRVHTRAGFEAHLRAHEAHTADLSGDLER